MAFSVNTNIASLQAQNYLRLSSEFQSKTINRVTSGLRIVSSGDDAAGLAIANGFRSDQAVLTQGIRNANDGLSTLQTIDGGISNISQLLDRARTLATQSASGTFLGNRNQLNSEFQGVIAEIDRQAQAIGLDSGGQFAKSLSVFIGGGKANAGTTSIENGSASVDLSNSMVDSKSLGLKGVQASGTAGVDIGAGAQYTSVSKILANTVNTDSVATAGYTDFYFQGPGFGDASRVKVSVNLSSVTDTSTLVTAVNAAIEAAGGTASQSATAFKNANIAASVVTDANGAQRLAFSSSSTAFQVQAGDRVSNALMGNFADNTVSVTGTAGVDVATNGGGTSATLSLSVDGGEAFNVTVTAGAAVTRQAIVNDLNANLTFSAVATASVDGTGKITIEGKSNTATSTITISNTTLSANLGLTSGGVAKTVTAAPGAGRDMDSTVTGVATSAATLTGNVIVRLQGAGMEGPVDITLTAGTTQVMIDSLYSQVSTNAALKAAGITVNQASVAGTEAIEFTGRNGESFSVMAVGDSGNNLGLGTWASGGSGFDYTSIISAGNITDPTAGTESAVLEFSIGGGAVESVTVAIATGATDQAIVNQVNSAISANATLSAAGIVASLSGTNLKLESLTNTAFRVRAADALTATEQLGFGAGTALGADASGLSGTTAVADVKNNIHVTSGGSSQTAVFEFNPILNGQDAQTLGFTAIDASGSAHSLSVVLKNYVDAAAPANTVQNARTLDEAINTINSALQQSNDATLKQIFAVKDAIVNETTGAVTEGVRFVSALGGFSVSLGAAGTGGAVGIGDSDEQGTVASSTVSNGGSTADISNQSTAQNAVTALSDAVTALGNSQAVVGKGQNTFNFAINLAQSQLTNLAAAESRIRDADLAAEAASLTKAQILMQAGTAALAQANSAPQAILSLLRG